MSIFVHRCPSPSCHVDSLMEKEAEILHDLSLTAEESETDTA